MPDAGFTEKRNQAFASDDLPDIILRAKISPQEEMKLSLIHILARSHDMTSGSIWRSLLGFSIPIMISNLVQSTSCLLYTSRCV